MILKLAKPFNPGDADAGNLYSHLHLELMIYNSSAYVVQLTYVYGTLNDDDVFIPGKASQPQSVSMEGQTLGELQNKMAGEGEPALPASIRMGYEHIIQALGIDGQLDYVLPLAPGEKAAKAAAAQDGDKSEPTAS